MEIGHSSLMLAAMLIHVFGCSNQYVSCASTCSTTNVGKSVQSWFKKLSEVSKEVAGSCLNLPQADKVTELENKISKIQNECSKNATKFEQFKTKAEIQFKELEKKMNDLAAKVNKLTVMPSKKKIKNGVLERRGDICLIKCINGAYAVRKGPFKCSSADFCTDDTFQCVAVRSCNEIKTHFPSTTSGLYKVLNKQGTASFEVYCDMTTANGGWTLAAVVANGDENNWIFGDSDRDYGDMTSLWENDAALGTVSNNTLRTAKDFKSLAFMEIEAKELLITFKGKNYIETDNKCLGDKTLKQLFNMLRFSCGGSSYNCHYGKCLGRGATSLSTRCDHACSVANFYQVSGAAGEPLANGQRPSAVLMKVGEAEGAQDGNKDRVYISTVPFRNNVDYVPGLGSFTSLSGNMMKTDISVRDDKSKESTDKSLFYGLLIR